MFFFCCFSILSITPEFAFKNGNHGCTELFDFVEKTKRFLCLFHAHLSLCFWNRTLCAVFMFVKFMFNQKQKTLNLKKKNHANLVLRPTGIEPVA